MFDRGRRGIGRQQNEVPYQAKAFDVGKMEIWCKREAFSVVNSMWAHMAVLSAAEGNGRFFIRCINGKKKISFDLLHLINFKPAQMDALIPVHCFWLSNWLICICVQSTADHHLSSRTHTHATCPTFCRRLLEVMFQHVLNGRTAHHEEALVRLPVNYPWHRR